MAAQGKETEAIADFTEAIARGCNDSDGFHARGLSYYRLRNYQRAYQDFVTATTLDGSNKLAWNHMGLALNAMGRQGQAPACHEQALKIDPTFKEGWVNIGQALKEEGKAEQAIEYCSKAIALDPNYTSGYQIRGIMHFTLGQHRQGPFACLCLFQSPASQTLCS